MREKEENKEYIKCVCFACVRACVRACARMYVSRTQSQSILTTDYSSMWVYYGDLHIWTYAEYHTRSISRRHCMQPFAEIPRLKYTIYHTASSHDRCSTIYVIIWR